MKIIVRVHARQSKPHPKLTPWGGVNVCYPAKADTNAKAQRREVSDGNALLVSAVQINMSDLARFND